MSATREPGHPSQSTHRQRYLTAKEAADLLGVNRATVINWARQGRFVGYQYGERGIYRFDIREIQRFMERSRLQHNQTDGLSPQG